MANTQEIVSKLIESDGVVRNALARGLVNVTALARYIQSSMRRQGRESSLEALVSAIRRYPIEEKAASQRNIGRLLEKLTMKNKIVDVAIINDPEIAQALGKFASQIDYTKGETFRIVAGVESIRVVIDEKNLTKMTSIIPKKNIRKIVANLAEIIISLSEVAERTPGVVSTVTTELAMNGINMIEFMSCVPELIIVVDEKDELRSYDSLKKLSKGSS